MTIRVITCPNCDTQINTTKRKKELQAVSPTKHNLKRLVTSVYDMQHMRFVFENRFASTGENIYAVYSDKLATFEGAFKDELEAQVRLYPVGQWITAQKGISSDMAGQMIGLIEDIGKFDNVSKLWSYAGMGVIKVCDTCGKKYLPPRDRSAYIAKTSKRLMEQYERKIVKEGSTEFAKKADSFLCHCEHPVIKSSAQRRIKGTLLDYNPTLKSLCWRYGKQFVMQGDYYRELYNQFRAEYESRDDLIEEVNNKAGKKTKHGTSKGTGHIHNMAQRKMVKVFLSHLWVVWRELEGLSTNKPWIIDLGGHSDYIAPPEPSVQDILDKYK